MRRTHHCKAADLYLCQTGREELAFRLIVLVCNSAIAEKDSVYPGAPSDFAYQEILLQDRRATRPPSATAKPFHVIVSFPSLCACENSRFREGLVPQLRDLKRVSGITGSRGTY